MQPGLLWSPRIWGRSSGNWGLFWSGSEASAPLREQDGQSRQVVEGGLRERERERELGLMGENGSGFGVAPSVVKADRDS